MLTPHTLSLALLLPLAAPQDAPLPRDLGLPEAGGRVLMALPRGAPTAWRKHPPRAHVLDPGRFVLVDERAGRLYLSVPAQDLLQGLGRASTTPLPGCGLVIVRDADPEGGEPFEVLGLDRSAERLRPLWQRAPSPGERVELAGCWEEAVVLLATRRGGKAELIFLRAGEAPEARDLDLRGGTVQALPSSLRGPRMLVLLPRPATAQAPARKAAGPSGTSEETPPPVPPSTPPPTPPPALPRASAAVYDLEGGAWRDLGAVLGGWPASDEATLGLRWVRPGTSSEALADRPCLHGVVEDTEAIVAAPCPALPAASDPAGRGRDSLGEGTPLAD